MSPISLPRIVAAAALLAMTGGWYFFRPERRFVDRRVDEPGPTTVERVLLTGSFEPRAHEGRGRVDVLDLGNGHRVVRFSDFETSDGPDLQVYLLGAADAANTDDLDRAGFVALGALKGNVGSQNYAISAETDLKKYRAVSVWCRRFGVNFTTAALGPPVSDGSTGTERAGEVRASEARRRAPQEMSERANAREPRDRSEPAQRRARARVGGPGGAKPPDEIGRGEWIRIRLRQGYGGTGDRSLGPESRCELRGSLENLVTPEARLPSP